MTNFVKDSSVSLPQQIANLDIWCFQRAAPMDTNFDDQTSERIRVRHAWRDTRGIKDENF